MRDSLFEKTQEYETPIATGASIEPEDELVEV